MNSKLERIEASMPHINHWTMASFRQNVTRKELQEILLYHENIMRAGHLCHAKTKHLGAGIYQLWYEASGVPEHGSGN